MPTVSIKQAIEKGLDNLNPEAYFPLIRFAHKNLNIHMENSIRKMIVDWAKHYIFKNGDFHLAKKILSSLDSTIAYVQRSLFRYNPTFAKRFFNYIQDKYAKSVVGQYLTEPQNKNIFIEATNKFAKDTITKKTFSKLKKMGIQLPNDHFKALNTALTDLINDIDDNAKTLNNITTLKTAMAPLSLEAQNVVLHKILQPKILGEDQASRFSKETVHLLLDDIQTKTNSYGVHLIKKAQADEVYRYDGLIKRVLPASIRGLYDVGRKVIENIALNGDTSKVEDLFNYEVASGARRNPTYKVGHTGASNRSATTLANVAMYFASKHGCQFGNPKSTWIMIYESSKGINTTELVNKSVNWTEFEFATPELKQSRFLGAVKFEIDETNSTAKEIAFKAVDGFVAPKVHQGNYRKEGIEGDIKQFLNIAKHFDKPTVSPKTELDFSLPRSSKKVAEERSFFQRIFDKLGLSKKPQQYREERLKQLKFVRQESDTERKIRLDREKANLTFWHCFSEQLDHGANYVKSWLPSFNSLVKDFEPEHKAEVVHALKKELKARKV